MQVHQSQIVVLGTGGTIAGRAASASDNVGYQAAQVGVGALLDGIAAPPGVALVSEQVAQLDSKDMEVAVWLALADRVAHWLAQPGTLGVVVTHGTDTMEETAYFLQAVLAPERPVVLTGAMRPATSAAADGPQNLADALAVAATPGARGVMVVFAGRVHDAQDVRKVHGYRTDAFSSDDAGVLAHVEEGRLRRVREWPSAPCRLPLEQLPAAEAWPRVEIVWSHAGASGRVVDALVAAGVDGIVVAATGSGTVHAALEAALRRAAASGVAVRRASRCAQGPLLAPGDAAIPPADHVSPVKARIALLLERMA